MVKYRCTDDNCRAEDSDRTTAPPICLVCWKCRAGKDTQNFSQMMELREGMFQVDADGHFPWERVN